MSTLRAKLLAEILDSHSVTVIDSTSLHGNHYRYTVWFGPDDKAWAKFSEQGPFVFAPEITVRVPYEDGFRENVVPFTWLERWSILRHARKVIKQREKDAKIRANTFPHDPPTQFDQAVMARYK